MSDDRSEKASELRKKQSRERGEGVRSRELTSSAAMLAGLLLLRGAAAQFSKAWTGTFATAISTGAEPVDLGDSLGRRLPAMLMPAMVPVAMVMFAALAGAVCVGAMQAGGIQLRPAALAWKPQRLNPGTNISNLFSTRSLLRLLKSLVPAGAVIAIATYTVRNSVLAMPVESYARLPLTFAAAYSLAVYAAWISLFWSGLDYINELHSWNKSLRMSKVEVKQEMKEANGNPHIKGRIRQIQRAMRKRRVKADVARAAVVITNPTHYAVALLFDYENMAAPKVLAKGRDLHALQMREDARWAGVPIVENPPLARALYRGVDEGQSIPYELYAAVAAILAFLFRQSNERAAARAGAQHRSYGYAPPRLITPVLEDADGDKETDR